MHEKQRRSLADFLGDAARIRAIPNGVPLLDLTRRAAARALKRPDLGLRETRSALRRRRPHGARKTPALFPRARGGNAARDPPRAISLDRRRVLSEAWDEWVAAHGLGDRIHRLPWRNDVPLLLLAADAFLHVAESEGLPLALLEAMSAALPCAITEHLLDEMPSLNASNSITIDETASGWKRFAIRERLRRLGAAARRVAEEKFSCGKMAESYEALYHETLAAS